MTDDVGRAFCKVMSILSGNTDVASCEEKWTLNTSGQITKDELSKYFNSQYGKGTAQKTKQVIMAVIGENGEK